MTHWIVAPIILPALVAPFVVLAARYHIGIQRVLSVAAYRRFDRRRCESRMAGLLTVRRRCIRWAIGPRRSASCWSRIACRL